MYSVFATFHLEKVAFKIHSFVECEGRRGKGRESRGEEKRGGGVPRDWQE